RGPSGRLLSTANTARSCGRNPHKPPRDDQPSKPMFRFEIDSAPAPVVVLRARHQLMICALSCRVLNDATVSSQRNWMTYGPRGGIFAVRARGSLSKPLRYCRRSNSISNTVSWTHDGSVRSLTRLKLPAPESCPTRYSTL